MDQHKSINQLRRLGPRLLEANLEIRTHESLNDELREFLFGYESVGITRDVDQIWYRARVLDDREFFDNLHELVYPPTPPNCYGRASFPGSNTLYGAWNGATAVAEDNGQPDALVHAIMFRPVVGVQFPCHVVGEYHRYTTEGKSFITDLPIPVLKELRRADPQRFAAFAYIDSIISRLFRREVAQNRNHEYKLTAIYSDLYHTAGKGLIYPSVRNPEAANLALHPQDFDSNFEVIGTQVITAAQSRSQGMVPLLRQAFDFHSDGSIKWNSRLVRPMEHNTRTGWRERSPIPGWRKAV